MTDEQIDLVQESFAKVAPIADQAADLFYGRLFETAPEVRELFPTEMGEQKKKLMQMIGVAVQNLRNADVLVPAVQALGERHVDYNVKDEHYDSVGGALLWTLEQGLHARGCPGVDNRIRGSSRHHESRGSGAR